MTAPLLQVSGLSVDRGRVRVLNDIELTIAPQEIVAVVGANGAGKSTLVQAVMGLIRPAAGRICCDGIDLTHRPATARARCGLGYVPEGRRVFPGLTTRDNLLVAASAPRRERDRRLAQVHALFPALQDKDRSPAWQLSGGQQQMLAIGRALMTAPRLLVLDEPTQGLAPELANELLGEIASLAAGGLGVLLTEQQAERAAIATRVLTLDGGRMVAAADGRCSTGADALKAEIASKNVS